MNAILNVFGSITAKIGVVLTVMAALTGASIGLAILVFGSIAGRVGELDTVYLPALHNSDQVIKVSGALQEGLSSLLLSTDSDQLQAVVADIRTAVDKAEQAIAALPADQVEKMNTNLGSVRASLDALVNARAAEFAAGAQVLQMRRDIDDIGIGLFAMLSGMAEASYEDLVLNGDETIAEIDQTLKTLVGRDFAALRLLLEARSEINLLSGVSLALASSRDPAMNSILGDLGRAAVARLGDMVPKMEAMQGLESVAPQTEEMRGIFDQVISGGAGAASARRDEIVLLRQSVENDFATVQDDLIFALAMNAEDAGESNGVKIRGLLDKQVSQIKYIAELRAGMRNVITESLESVLTETPEEQDAADEQLAEAAGNLRDLLEQGDAEINSAFEPLLALVAPTGISAKQRDYVDARMMRSILAEQATSSVGMIVSDARAVADVAADGIGLATAAIDAEISGAVRLMQGIAAASVLVLLAAPAFAFFVVVRPLLAVTNATERLAKGDLEVVSKLGRRRAEIGRMIAALGVFRDGLIEKARLESEERANAAAREQAARTAAAERAAQQERERAMVAEQEQRERDREAAEHARREAAQAAAEAERQQRQAIQEKVVRELAQGLGKLAEGDLRAKITTEFGEGYDQLRLDFNAAVDTLEDVIGRIQQSVASIHSGSGEITHATDDLSRRTERTAATLEESAAALTELTASVSSAAVGASEADSLVTSVRKSAARSSEVVNEAVVAMGEIENSSRKISKITDVIDDIAFQTNLLALNAGVEAARAGDAGRGFAVVASEVRALAQRSSEAAREINSLISESGVQVSRGVDRVDQVGRVLREIVESIAEISGHVAGIAASTREQSAGITEINTAIGQLDQTTQQNAAMVEETTAASHTLTEEASTLSSTISRFVLSADWAGQSAAPTRRRA